jgi:gamma-glutamylcyclotransferase (GGCT)/AIG2-like uncharacterized protein YtfP
MSVKLNKVFVYGTLLQGELRSRFLSDCKLLKILEIPGTLYDTKRGYPAALFERRSRSTVSGELYIMGNPDKKIAELDAVEDVDSGLFKKVILKHKGEEFISYEAGPLLKEYVKPINKIETGSWRRHSSLSFHNPLGFTINFEDRQKYLYRESLTSDSEGSIYITGDVPLIVTAPHASVHKRMGKLKRQEFYTGALSVMLHSLTGCHVLYTNRLMEVDPSYYDDSSFKVRLSEIAKKNDINFLIDLHGTGPEKRCEIYPGAGVDKEFLLGHDNYLEELERAASLNDISIGGLDVFPAAKQMTVAKFAARTLGVPSIQFEINRRLREPEKSPDDFMKLVKFLKGFVENLSYLLS